ncbi:MAG TPA: efflux RND transporter periplasmic adaptor subunit [Polyangia bacterium]|nr:efflux RND transporter periplasmic adaptor subunit [Polyangia bacterium]
MKTRTLLWAALAVLSCAKGAPQTAAVGDLELALAIDPDPPTSGDNRLLVTIKDASGNPVDGAHIAFVYGMPAMGAMPEMKGGGEVKPQDRGRYQITYRLPMAGDWSLTLGIDAQGHPHQEVGLKVSPPHKGFRVQSGRGSVAGAGAGAGAGTGTGTGAVIEVSPERQQLIGVTFATVEQRPLAVTLRAAGLVEVDERKVGEVTLKYEAFVEKLLVGETGKAVRTGQALATLYSPDLLAAEQELLAARRTGGAPEIVGAITQRLTHWDITKDQIAALERRDKADGRATIYSPASGVVLEKNVVEGAHVMPGTMLYRIGNLGRVWVQAAIYERDAARVAVGQPATITLPSQPDSALEARVTFVAPTVDQKTRTLEARLELINPRLTLRPGMFADVVIEVPLGVALAVPDSALLLSGEHRYAFVDRGQGRLQPVEVQVGVQAGEYHEVKAGLAAGDRVALSATFLLSSEAKLRDALPRWRAAP